MFIHATLRIPRLPSLLEPRHNWCILGAWLAIDVPQGSHCIVPIFIAYTYVYGTSKILPLLKKMPCYTVHIIVRNVAIKGIFSLDLVSFWCHTSSIPCVTITKKVFLVCTNSYLDTSWGIHELRHSESNEQELWGWIYLQPCRQFIIDLGLLQ